jgi:amino acid adenylation domain-containing protein
MTTKQSLIDRPMAVLPHPDAGPSSFPLLPLQQGMLFNLFADPTSGIDLNQIVSRTPERLDLAAFAMAWQRVLDRHPALRTTFRWETGEEPRQEVSAHAVAVVQGEDWREVAGDEREARLAQFLAADRHRETLLTRCPVWRVAVFDHGDQGFTFVFTCPHAVMDGQSLYLVFEEFFAMYEALSLGQEIELPPPPPFSEFIAWAGDRDHAAAEQYWRDKFKGFPGLPTLLIPRPEMRVSGRGEQTIQFSPELASQLRALAKAHRVTMSLVMKAAWAALLSRLCGSLDVTFGEVRWGRLSTVKNAGSMIGLFINTIPVRVSMTPATTVSELLQFLREDQGTVREHEHTGLHDIQQWAGIQPGSALLETLFIFDQSSFEAPLRKKGGRWAERRFSNAERTSLPLTLNIHAEPELEIRVSYERARFADPFMMRMLEYFGVLLDRFVADPSQSVSALAILPAREWEQLSTTWNSTEREVRAEATVPQLFEEQVARTPDRPALQSSAGELTYRQLDARVSRLARHLRKIGVGPNVLVGVCLDRCDDMLVSLLATMKAGGAYVPIDPAFPVDRVRLMVDDAAPAVVLTSTRHSDRFSGTPSRVVCLDGPVRADIDREPSEAAGSPARAADLAYVIYTSGSTGRPKGVMLTHANVVNCFVGMDHVLGRPQGGTWLAVTSISFDISVLELFYTLTRGFTIVLGGETADGGGEAAGAGGDRRDAGEPSLGDLITRHRVTHLQCTPSLAKMMLADPGTRAALRSLEVLMLGGEALPEELLRRLGKAPGRTILNMYGPTETTIWSTSAPVGGTLGLSIGRPIANTRLYVVDHQLQPTPIGVPGELLIGGKGVARGYLGRPELTAERFLSNRFDDAGGLVYRTGDLVKYRDDGTVEYLGRLDHQVKIHGHRIELGEIETVLQTCPGVADTAVIVREDVGDEPRLVAYFISDADAVSDLGVLRSFLSDRLPAYMIPQDFVPVGAFPLTPNGKLDRQALPRPNMDRSAAAAEFMAPRNATEEALAQAWIKVLGIDSVSIRDNFFDRGGNSVMVVHLSRSVRARFAVEMPLASFFQYPTIEGMAALIASRAGARHDNPWATVESHAGNLQGAALIGIHGVENIFTRLRKHLPGEEPFVIITSRVGFDGRIAPYFPCRSIEEMADNYLAELRAIQPHGPYSLLGFCMGGLIAMEVARRLLDDDEQVGFLGIINALPRAVASGDAGRGVVDRHLGALADLGFRARLAYVAGRAMRTAGDWQRRFRQSVAGSIYHQFVRAGFPVDAGALARRIGDFGEDMMCRYAPRPYPGKIWLFHGSHGPADTRQLWESVALGGLEAHGFETDHFGLMTEPHVIDLAIQLTECRSRAEDELASAGERPQLVRVA